MLGVGRGHSGTVSNRNRKKITRNKIKVIRNMKDPAVKVGGRSMPEIESKDMLQEISREKMPNGFVKVTYKVK